MQTFSQRGYKVVVVLCWVVVSVFLTGCPKKVSPLGKTKSPQTQQEGVPSTDTEKFGEGNLTSLQEEDMPFQNRDTLFELPPAGTELKPGEPPTLNDIFFDFGQWHVRSDNLPTLKKNASWLSENESKKIEIEGHADKRGTNEYNLVLAEKRAAAVQEYLVQLGIASSKILVVSYGEERPFCTKEDEACFQENRRAHFNVK
jgi:peptidoglycan-associated lipoprotein